MTNKWYKVALAVSILMYIIIAALSMPLFETREQYKDVNAKAVEVSNTVYSVEYTVGGQKYSNTIKALFKPSEVRYDRSNPGDISTSTRIRVITLLALIIIATLMFVVSMGGIYGQEPSDE